MEFAVAAAVMSLMWVVFREFCFERARRELREENDRLIRSCEEWERACSRESELTRKLIAECELRSAKMVTLQNENDRLRSERNEAYGVVYAADEFLAGRISLEQFRDVVEGDSEAEVDDSVDRGF